MTLILGEKISVHALFLCLGTFDALNLEPDLLRNTHFNKVSDVKKTSDVYVDIIFGSGQEAGAYIIRAENLRQLQWTRSFKFL